MLSDIKTIRLVKNKKHKVSLQILKTGNFVTGSFNTQSKK